MVVLITEKIVPIVTAQRCSGAASHLGGSAIYRTLSILLAVPVASVVTLNHEFVCFLTNDKTDVSRKAACHFSTCLQVLTAVLVANQIVWDVTSRHCAISRMSSDHCHLTSHLSSS